MARPSIIEGALLGRWLPFLNTYRTICMVPSPELQRLLEGVRDLRLAA